MKDINGQETTYGKVRTKQIIDECFLISKFLHTTYTEVLDLPLYDVTEIINLISDDNKRQQEEFDKISQKGGKKTQNKN